MTTLDELKAELLKEQKLTAAKKEIENLGKEKKHLQKQIKSERTNRKFGKFIDTFKMMGRTIKITKQMISEKIDAKQKLQEAKLKETKELEKSKPYKPIDINKTINFDNV